MGNEDIIDQISEEWGTRGIDEGDTILLHSSCKRTFLRYSEKFDTKIGPGIILNSFLKAIGKNGTLLLPLFNFDFTKGVPFDFYNTPSQMGILTEFGRKQEEFIRTGHPIYSFAVSGWKKERFRGVNNFSGYGSDSPFGILRELDGKIAILDLPDQHSMTFYHHIEEMTMVDYRFHKKFSGQYIDEDRIETRRTYGLFVRDLDRGVVTHVNPMGELLWEHGLYYGDREFVDTGLRTIKANSLFKFVAEYIANGLAEGLLYRIEGESK